MTGPRVYFYMVGDLDEARRKETQPAKGVS